MVENQDEPIRQAYQRISELAGWTPLLQLQAIMVTRWGVKRVLCFPSILVYSRWDSNRARRNCAPRNMARRCEAGHVRLSIAATVRWLLIAFLSQGAQESELWVDGTGLQWCVSSSPSAVQRSVPHRAMRHCY